MSTNTANTPRRAIYLPASGVFEIMTQTAAYIPTGSQVLVRVHYSAINPADKRHFYMGWHSFVAGYDWLGTVEMAGPTAAHAVGDTLFGLVTPGRRRPIETGAHQDLILAPTGPGSATYRVPTSLLQNGIHDDEVRQLVAWPAALRTASDALVNSLGFALPTAGVGGEDPTGRAILIPSISPRRRAFSPIYTTASTKNHAALLALGATHAFDYRPPTVVDEIRAAATASELAVVFDAVATGTGFAEPPREGEGEIDLAKSSPAIAAGCVTDGVPEEKLKLCAALPLPHDPRWTFCLGRRDPAESAQMAEFDSRVEVIMAWALEQLASPGRGFRFPNIRLVKGADAAIEAINDVFDGKASMEKFVIQHPI
ncbi:hypothetical protein GQX73_g7274 [Xylaria multiplex]|uniref:Alcohol dehydrogenase-like N-terminal domain-containing protein n=1 Tax=Xylaria multiplex TaxID=323545 RepID=A0A7C8IL98_9PEZI|nr:hypothetical protein GQX73_g7274 [Xylaria multiplex]